MSKVHANRFKSAEFRRNIWDAIPEAGTPFDDLLKPEYWAHVAANLRPWDRIEVRAEDGSYYAELLVRDAGRLWAKVECLRKHDLGADTGQVPDVVADVTYSVQWRGPHSKHAVMRERGNGAKEVLRDQFETREAAEAWKADHMKAMAA